MNAQGCSCLRCYKKLFQKNSNLKFDNFHLICGTFQPSLSNPRFQIFQSESRCSLHCCFVWILFFNVDTTSFQTFSVVFDLFQLLMFSFAISSDLLLDGTLLTSRISKLMALKIGITDYI